MFGRLIGGTALLAVLAAHGGATWGEGGRPAGAPEQITVSAAISLSDALGDAADVYASSGGGQVAFNFAASNVLARQIVNGARVDMFISADERQMDVVERAGLVASGTRVPLVANHLALIAPATDAFITSVPSLLDVRVRRIALGDPEAVPAGVYARQYLERAGLWPKLRGRVVPTGSVRAALAAVSNRAADAGFVYVTDVRGAPHVRLVARIEGPAAPRIVYPMCIVTSGRHPPEAQRFHAFLTQHHATAVFRRHGFQAPPDP
jgi:molybdate transport system substrate-binding protein